MCPPASLRSRAVRCSVAAPPLFALRCFFGGAIGSLGSSRSLKSLKFLKSLGSLESVGSVASVGVFGWRA